MTATGRRPHGPRAPLRRLRDESGAVAILVALSTSTFLLGFAALAVDLGQVYTRRGQVQAVADLAALAGARRLPDVGAARTQAVEALCAPANAVAGWDTSQVCPVGDDVPAWTSDGDPANGEISFLREDADGDGRYGPREQLGAGAAEAVAIRVVAPTTTVTFGLAKTLGADRAEVQEAATARIGTPLGMGMVPFAVTTADLTPQGEFRFCILDPDAGAPAATGPCSRPDAARGHLVLPRRGVADAGAALAQDIRRGVEPTVRRWPADPADVERVEAALAQFALGPTLNGVQCGALEPVVDLLSIEPLVAGSVRDVNCVEARTRGFAQDMTEGLLGGETGAEGRLTRRCSDSEHFEQGTFAIDGTDLLRSPSPLVRGIAPEELASRIRTGAAPVPGLISDRAFTCPRLVTMPVIDTATVLDGGQYPVVDITYAWIDDDGEGLVWQDASTLMAVTGHVVDPGYFPDTVSGSPVVGRYLGDDLPKEAVLVADLTDP